MDVIAHALKFGKKSDIWSHMAGRTATGKDDAFHILKPPISFSFYRIVYSKKISFPIVLHHYHIFQFAAPVLYCSSARANWSGQEVFLNPHLMPLSLAMASSTLIPETRAEMPFRLPLHPPVNATDFMMSSSTSKSISWEQVPLVLYCINYTLPFFCLHHKQRLLVCIELLLFYQSNEVKSTNFYHLGGV